MDDMQEIIARPPSHPIATTLLFCSMLGTILAIYIVSLELFGEYLPTPKPGDKANDSKAIAQEHRHDHYGKQYPGAQNQMEAAIDAELHPGKAQAGQPGQPGQPGGQPGTPPPGP